jgi:hypothetical protein
MQQPRGHVGHPYSSVRFCARIDLPYSKMRPINHKDHRIAVHPKWNAETRSWACDATVYITEAGRSKTIPFFDLVRRYKIKASAVTAILNAIRCWIDHGKPEQFPEQ